jgi:hypothetical protein
MNIKLIDSLVQIINSLTTEERTNLEKKLQVQTSSTEIDQSNFRDEPFVGMWKDREDMEDSSQWVSQLRQQEWTS